MEIELSFKDLKTKEIIEKELKNKKIRIDLNINDPKIIYIFDLITIFIKHNTMYLQAVRNTYSIDLDDLDNLEVKRMIFKK